MVRETRLHTDQLVYPIFIREGRGLREEIRSMPGQYRYTLDVLAEEIDQLKELGIPALMLFGIPEHSRKDPQGSQAYDEEGIICRALRSIKEQAPELVLMADVCLCEYTSHGHCGLLTESGQGVDNDATLELLAQTALAYARAGADVVAPSDMMDGRVAAIRQSLDDHGFLNLPILSYAIKYASAFYGPFREAAGSTPQFGDRRSYQMDPANSREAVREALLDLEEGADILLVKPALPCLDIIREVREVSTVPLAAYQVSGEYSALCAAFSNGWLQREAALAESLLSIRRAGADLILTYFAKEAAGLIQKGSM